MNPSLQRLAMFRKKITLFKLLGFSVSVEPSWIVILFLVIWSLAKGLFPAYYPNLQDTTYWLMGFLGALGFFVSIIIHEFSHSIVARRYGLPIRGITLFIFGGVAQMEEEPPSAKAEFLMAIAGPIASVVLALLCWWLYGVAKSLGWPVWIVGILGYLGGINAMLALFNMIPAFPTDGGRVLRSVIWWQKGDMLFATRIAVRISVVFAMIIIFFGFLNLAIGNFIGGLWWVLIGTFLYNAANASYGHLLMEQSFRGKKIRHVMSRDPITVPPDITIWELMEDYVYTYHYKMFPVARNGEVLGLVSSKEIKKIPKEEWGEHTVEKIAMPLDNTNTISPDATVKEAIVKMSEGGLSRLLVIENSKMVGIVTLKDLLDLLSLKMEFEE